MYKYLCIYIHTNIYIYIHTHIFVYVFVATCMTCRYMYIYNTQVCMIPTGPQAHYSSFTTMHWCDIHVLCLSLFFLNCCMNLHATCLSVPKNKGFSCECKKKSSRKCVHVGSMENSRHPVLSLRGSVVPCYVGSFFISRLLKPVGRFPCVCSGCRVLCRILIVTAAQKALLHEFRVPQGTTPRTAANGVTSYCLTSRRLSAEVQCPAADS